MQEHKIVYNGINVEEVEGCGRIVRILKCLRQLVNDGKINSRLVPLNGQDYNNSLLLSQLVFETPKKQRKEFQVEEIRKTGYKINQDYERCRWLWLVVGGRLQNSSFFGRKCEIRAEYTFPLFFLFGRNFKLNPNSETPSLLFLHSLHVFQLKTIN